jgi:hypothetical protein
MRNRTDAWNTMTRISKIRLLLCAVYANGSAISLSVSLMIRLGSAMLKKLPLYGL